jgi:hypothetical protein
MDTDALSPSAAPEDRSVSMARANGFALLAVGPPVAALAWAFVALHGWGPIAVAGRLPLLALGAALLAGVILHEVLHAVAWKWASGLPWRDIAIGFQWRTFTPFAHARVPMTARAYRIGAATPGALLGLGPSLAGLATGDGAAILFGLLFTFAAGGDALVLWMLRGVRGARLVQDHPTRAGCYVWPEEGVRPTNAVGS